MRISRFCEARGWYEADNSIESKIFCFGEDGPSGDTSSTAASEDIGTADVDKGPTSGPNQRDDSGDRQAYEDRFGGTSTRNFNIDTSQNFVDTDQGRVYGSTDVLSAGMASGDITPSGDQATADFTAGLPGPEPSLADFDTTNVPEFDEPAGAVSLFDIPGVTPPGSYASTPITQAAKGPALGTTDYEFDAMGTGVAVPGPANIQGERTDIPDALKTAAARGRVAEKGIDVSGMGPGGISSPMDSMGVRDLDTIFDTSDFFLGMGTGVEPSQPATTSTSPVDQITAQARGNVAPTGSVTINQPTTGFSSTTDVATGLPPVDLDETPAGALNPFAEMEKEVAQGLGARTAAPGPTGIETTEIPGFEPTNYGPADLAEAQRNLERVQASTPNEFGFRTGLPTTFGDTGIPTGIGMLEGAINAVANPEASVANAISRYGIEGKGGRLQITQVDGRTVAYDPKTNIVYDTNPYSIMDIPDQISAVYDRKRAIDEQQQAMTGGTGADDGGPIIPPAQEVVPEPVQEEYQGRNVVQEAGYQPRGPMSYAYTGLPSLAPQRLRPSFQARGQYSPLFPIGQRRS